MQLRAQGRAPLGGGSARGRPRAAAGATAPVAPRPPRRGDGPPVDAPAAPSFPVFGSRMMVDINRRYASAEVLMREKGWDAMQVELLGTKAIIFRHPEDVAALTRSPQRFPKVDGEGGLSKLHEWLGDGLLTNRSPEAYAAVKDILMPAFRAASIRGFVPAFAACGEEAAAVLEAVAGTAYDVEPLSRRVTLDVIGRTGFGYNFRALEIEARAVGAAGRPPSSAHGAAAATGGQGAPEDVVRVLDGIFGPGFWLAAVPVVPRALVPGLQGYIRGIKLIDDVIAAMIAERRASGITEEDTDLLSFMLRAQAEGNAAMTDKQLRDELQTMILAGSDTTATTLAFALYELSRHPPVLAACQAEADAAFGGAPPASVPADTYQTRLPLVSAVASETLRLYPSAPEVARQAADNDVMGGIRIPKGMLAFGSIYGAHRHEAFWPRAEEWLPERWLPENAPALAPHADVAFLPFSVGPRSCIGRYFATLELTVLLATIVHRVDLLPAPGPPAESRQKFTLGTKDGARLVAAPRAAAGRRRGGAAAEAAAQG